MRHRLLVLVLLLVVGAAAVALAALLIESNPHEDGARVPAPALYAGA